MRTFANTLLFSNVLENIPTTVNGNIYAATQVILNLPISIVEADCKTLLGTEMPLSLGLIGYIEVATGQPLTTARINYLLGQGQIKVYVRSTSSCISSGGICQTCYEGSYAGTSLPPVGSTVAINPTYLVGNQYFFGNGTQTQFPIIYDMTNAVGTTVYVGDVLIPFNYSIINNYLTFTTAPNFNTIIAIRSLVRDTSAFLDILSKSYSGDLLGSSPRSTGFQLPVKRSLYETALNGSIIQSVESVVDSITQIPQYLVNYGKSISSSLESALFHIYLYLIYT